MKTTGRRIAVIIGAGPAGLTAAYELLQRSDVHPIVFESSEHIGGIARTVNYKGNRIDIGPHRFFSKSSRVMCWWLNMLPLQSMNDQFSPSVKEFYRNLSHDDLENGPDPNRTDRVMLVRERLTRILFRRCFFDYPLSINPATLRNLGVMSLMKIAVSYLRSRLLPIRPESSLEDFFVNRFGRELYRTFFKDYTEKVWGVPCRHITHDWGAQRIKGLSFWKAVADAIQQMAPRRSNLQPKTTETSLIHSFLYPKYGSGQMWEEVARQISAKGGEVHLHHSVVGIDIDGSSVTRVQVRDGQTGRRYSVPADFVMSTMPIRDLVLGMNSKVPEKIKEIARNLQYRDLIAVGLLFRRLKTSSGTLPDNWIYVQEPDVKVGRIQVFNNWSPYLLSNPSHVWLGMEYFCQESDELWRMPDSELVELGAGELENLKLAAANDWLDGIVLRVPKAYPAYLGSYEDLPVLRNFLNQFGNLYTIGRNGMHRYNNMDHSMLAAMIAVDNIVANDASKENIWNVNTEADYHEEK